MRSYRAFHAVAVPLVIGLSSSRAVAQPSTVTTKVATRPLGAITAVSIDSLGGLVAVRALSDGGVMVNDFRRQRVRLFDPTLKTSKIVIDSGGMGAGATAMPMSVTSTQLIPFPGDSTLFVDVASSGLLVLDAKGKVAHVMSLPKPRDAMFLATAQTSSPGIDPKGRLVYRGFVINMPTAPAAGGAAGLAGFRLPEQPDSAPIVRADFDTRKVDTIVMIKALKPGSMTMSPEKGGGMSIKIIINPLDTGDEWAMLTDGTVAVVRAHDYHVDFVDPDGTKRSAPKMPFDWKRLTDEQKQIKIDSLRPELEKQLKAVSGTLPMIPTENGMRKISFAFDFPPIKDIGDYEPSVSPGSVRADLDNQLWIAPRTAVPGGDGGLRYDVVNRKGDLVERVQFPKGRVLVGFAPGGIVYLLNTNGTTSVLERAKLK